MFYNFQLGMLGGPKREPTNLIKVGDFMQRDFLLFFHGVTHRFLNSLQEEVKSSWVLSTHHIQLSSLNCSKGSGSSWNRNPNGPF